MDDNNTRSVNDDGELQTTMQPYMSDNDAATNATEAQTTASVGSALKDAPVVAWRGPLLSPRSMRGRARSAPCGVH